jgi:hypothetical protein
MQMMNHVRVHILNQPISDEATKSSEFTPRYVVPLVNEFNCLVYDWMIKDE